MVRNVDSRVCLFAVLYLILEFGVLKNTSFILVEGAKARRGIFRFFSRNRTNKSPNENEKEMGQVIRVMKYDRAENFRNAIPGLQMAGNELKWFRLDDGVMGGQSETVHAMEDGRLHFKGTVNTNGGGFVTMRATFPEGMQVGPKGIRLKLQGDGKTYKFFLTDGASSQGGPMSRKPSWQIDIPTKDDGKMHEVDILFDKLRPSFGPRVPSDPSKYTFDAKEMKEMGLMLSLLLSDGSKNPVETFGDGIFPFSLLVESIENLI